MIVETVMGMISYDGSLDNGVIINKKSVNFMAVKTTNVYIRLGPGVKGAGGNE